MDIFTRKSQKHLREQEKIEEFTISTLIKAGIKDYTKDLKDFINSNSRLSSKKILEAMYKTDEATLSLIVLRTIIQVLINENDNKKLLSSISKIISKSVLHSKTLKSLENQHKSLSVYIDKMYKRVSDSKRLKAKMRSQLNLIGKTKEAEILEEGTVAQTVGTVLIQLLACSTEIIEIIKLDSKSRWQGKSYFNYKPYSYVVQFTDECKYSILDLENLAEEFLKPNVLPVLKRPRLVTKWLNTKSDLIRTGRPNNLIKMPRRKSYLKHYRAFIDKVDISKFAKIHHIIEGTAWTINEDVLKVIEDIFKNNIEDKALTRAQGEHYAYHPTLLGGLPRRYSLDVDKMIDKSKLGRTYITEKGRVLFEKDEKDALNRFNNIKNDLLAFNEKNLNKALSLQSMINLARDFKDKKFYYTYQYDTRGRIYPVQAVLNPQSTNWGKALLKFAKGKELTEEGHYWAKIHGANTFGIDKETLENRVAFIDNMMEDIKNIAKSPLLFSEKWCHADNPFGFLAWCIEYNKVLENSNYPYALATSLDASCSGIQIYSGLLKDKEGARAVNVIGDTREDIYGMVAEVANRLLRDREYDRYLSFTNANGEVSEIDFRPIGDSLAGKIDRSISKRNTMTQPYSVTLKGMQEQLKETFTELEENNKKFWVGEIWEVSRLLAEIHQKAIDEVVQGAKKGKDFIKHITGKCALRNKGLIYTSDIGFPVYQKNLKTKSIQIESHIWTPQKGTQRVQFRAEKKISKIDINSQKNSSAPNLIHSLDATLLQKTVEDCYMNNDIKDFALIHDSYGTHPNDISTLNRAVREQYIKLFSKDVLYDWAIEVLSNAGYTYEEMLQILKEVENPMIDTLDLNDVQNATYMFS